MSNRKIFSELDKKKLNECYLKYLERCYQNGIQPNWSDLHNEIKTKIPALPSLTEKQLNNKVIDYRKIHGAELWPTFNNYKDIKVGILYKKLFERSEDSFFLAIEIYNRIKQNSKVEVFCILIINAWELLLKGFLVKEDGERSIYIKDHPNKTIAISDALKKVITNENDLTRKNLEKLIELRDQAIHFLIPEIQSVLSRLFQASIFNYLKMYGELTGKKLDFENETGLISLIIDNNNFSGSILEKTYGFEATDNILKFVKDLEDEANKYNSSQYIIPIEYKLVLSKIEKEGDIFLHNGTTSQIKHQGIIIEVAKDPDTTHPFLSKDVIFQVNKELVINGKMPINQYSLQAILYKEKIRNEKSSKYHYMVSRPKTHKYSQEFIDLIIQKCCKDINYIEKCNESYKISLDKKRKEKSKVI